MSVIFLLIQIEVIYEAYFIATFPRLKIEQNGEFLYICFQEAGDLPSRTIAAAGLLVPSELSVFLFCVTSLGMDGGKTLTFFSGNNISVKSPSLTSKST